MDKAILIKTVARLVTPPRGILAIDESIPTVGKRFENLSILNTEEKRQEYRELLITAPEIENYISGYILFDETLRQSAEDGRSFVSVLESKGIEVGIKVDAGPVDSPLCPGEKVTAGIEGLSERLKEYRSLGAVFAKWRAIYTVGEHTPSAVCMKLNAENFAKYALLCQENGIVPIVEPEVLINGVHTMEQCYEATTKNLRVVFDELKAVGVFLPGMILKTSMVLPGEDNKVEVYDKEIAQLTVKCLKEEVPEEIGGIVFLSGGQDAEKATLRLNEMHHLGPLPWPLTFSYARAIQNPALEAWAVNPIDLLHAQTLLVERARANSLASIGEYEG